MSSRDSVTYWIGQLKAGNHAVKMQWHQATGINGNCVTEFAYGEPDLSVTLYPP